jgi:diguanylate cyclase (GGDEF)-like protein
MKSLLLVSHDPLLITIADRLLAGNFRTIFLGEMVSALDIVYNDIPDLLIVDLTSEDAATMEIINNLKDDPMFNQLPVLVIVGEHPPVTRWEDLFAEDWLRYSDLERDLFSRASLAIIRSRRIVEINPLTRLPGNISINRQIQERMDRSEIFSLAYADLSDFKPFNDKYGFSRGDEVIKITGRLLLNMVKNRQTQGSFVGHIGGDDFVFIMDPSLIEATCSDLIRAFDQIIPTVYDPEDREKGGISSVDRHGVARFFSFIGLAIGVTGTANRRFSHFGELTGAASEMKCFVKKTQGSSYSIDQRLD